MLPRRCAVCSDKLLSSEDCLCGDCLENIPLSYFWTMDRNPMADKFNEKIESKRSGEGAVYYEPYSNAAALYFYKGGYKNLSKALKYHADVSTGRYMSNALGRKLKLSPELCDANVIVPVPLHRRRLRERGYNQAEIIASCVALQLGAGMYPELLKRKINTASQATLDVKSKSSNVSGAFCVDSACLERLIGTLGGKMHVLLVDDVFTSGSTLCECQRVLRNSLVELLGERDGARVRISAATLAYVGD